MNAEGAGPGELRSNASYAENIDWDPRVDQKQLNDYIYSITVTELNYDAGVLNLYLEYERRNV